MSPRPAVVLVEGASGGRNSSPAGEVGGLGGPALQLDPDRRAGCSAPLLPLRPLRRPAPGRRQPGDPAARREPYARARGLNAQEVARLLEAIPEDSAAELRLRALVLAYLLTGRRRSGVLHLRWRDLDLEGGWDPS